MKQIISIALTLFISFFCCSQGISKKLILAKVPEGEAAFDKEGNYCFQIKENGLEYFWTGKEKIGRVKFIGTTGGSGGSINYTNAFSDSSGKPWYYKNSGSVNILGPVTGKLERYMSSDTKRNIAITVSRDDSVFFYVNGRLVSGNRRSILHAFDIDLYDWCAFSENGNAIYYIKKDALYLLYVNGKFTDSSAESFNALHINNAGDYIYAEGRKSDSKQNGYDYMFFVHSKDTVIGPVRTVWHHDLTEEGSWYFTGDDNGSDYMLINNNLQKGIKDVEDITLSGKKSFLYKFKKDGKTQLNVNENIYSYPDILLPAINSENEYSFYGIKDYYLYKFINGKQQGGALTRFGIRPEPWYIDPKGASLLSFVTDDSVYIYRDDSLLLKPVSRKVRFEKLSYDELFPGSSLKTGTEHSLFYIRYNAKGFWIFDGRLSKPMLPASENSYSDDPKKGEIVAGDLKSNGFFFIQSSGGSAWTVNINNSIYRDITGVNKIFSACFFKDHELIFYGLEGRSLYRYTLAF